MNHIDHEKKSFGKDSYYKNGLIYIVDNDGFYEGMKFANKISDEITEIFINFIDIDIFDISEFKNLTYIHIGWVKIKEIKANNPLLTTIFIVPHKRCEWKVNCRNISLELFKYANRVVLSHTASKTKIDGETQSLSDFLENNNFLKQSVVIGSGYKDVYTK